MLEDSQGFLWFATDLGVCRFNGYEFHRPVDTSAVAGNAAFRMTEDAEGRIWFNRLNGSVWYVQNDTVRSWKYNPIIKSYQGKFINLGNLAVEKNGTVWTQLPGFGILVVQSDSSHQVLQFPGGRGSIFASVQGKVFLHHMPLAIQSDLPHFTREMFRWKDDRLLSLGRFPVEAQQLKKVKTVGMWQLRNGYLLYNFLQTFYLLHNDRLVWIGAKDIIVNDIYEDNQGAILLASIDKKNRGLLYFRSLEHFLRNEFTNILPEHNIACTQRDHEGGWWVATTDAGIFYCKNPEVEIFDTGSGLPFNDVQSITSDQQKQTIFVSLCPKGICAIQQNRVKPLPTPSGWLNSNQSLVSFDTETNRLWYNPLLCFWEKGHWQNVYYKYESQNSYNPISIKKNTVSRFNKLWWASAHTDFYSIDPVSEHVVRYYADSLKYWRTHSVVQDFEGTIWVAVEGDGLRIWRNNRYEPPTFYHPALQYPVRLLEILPDSSLLLSLRGGGLLIRKTNGQFTHLTTKDGLSTNWLSELDITPEGIIYASSNAGLNILRPQGNGLWQVETLNIKHGLPSDQVNDVTLLGDNLWVATDQGVAHFKGKPPFAPTPMPLLERFVVNNEVVPFSEYLQLTHHQNNIALRFFALHYRSGGNINYRYRLIGTDTGFVYTHNREVNFVNLRPGNYHFEVQAQTEEGAWSPSAHWTFDILPPWWATWWFRLLAASGLCAVGFLFYRSRLRDIRREAAEHEKMRDLEAAALRAQMNPHFIFNCLQAIQSFIARNERDVAIRYLASFAKLVRLTLHSSVEGRHSLAEEMAMLENYLHLERMRFNGHFEFVIRTSPGVDPDEISLPPLLVQPFVENALIHGLKERETGAWVEVVFTQKTNTLEVTVTDNGIGFSEKEKSALVTKPHNSVGMMLTQKRLDLLARAGKNASGHFSRENLFDENGGVAGTCIRFEVPVL